MSMRDGVGIKEKTGPHDLVTEADHACSHILTTGLRKRFPADVIISEEDENHHQDVLSENIWLVDPIDGTDNYVKNDGQYCVMIGLLTNLKPSFGWIYAPPTERLYFGGPKYGSFHQVSSGTATEFQPLSKIDYAQQTPTQRIRLAMGRRDRRNNPWIADIPDIEWLMTGSIGLKVAKILDDEADLFVHLSGKLKVWDSAAPVALALGAGLDVGALEADDLHFPLPAIRHESTIVIGKSGALTWSRAHLKEKAGL